LEVYPVGYANESRVASVTDRQRRLRRDLDALYTRMNRASEIQSDPLAAVLAYACDRDREVVGLIASALAYGRVAHIQTSVRRVLEALEDDPHAFLTTRSAVTIRARVRTIRHRFSSGVDIGDLLVGIKRIVEHDGSLGARFDLGFDPSDDDIVPAADRFVAALVPDPPAGRFRLLPAPRDGSACKRLFMYLRWMLRRDSVDPGPWEGMARPYLLVPIDTHMHRVGRVLRFTRRNAADLATAREVTAGFRRLRPEDPVRYDFSLTRLGMRGEMDAVARLGRP
jgi:uncharacterized protein (TIGR02757 family)